MSGLILLQTVLRSDGILYSMKFIEKKIVKRYSAFNEFIKILRGNKGNAVESRKTEFLRTRGFQ